MAKKKSSTKKLTISQIWAAMPNLHRSLLFAVVFGIIGTFAYVASHAASGYIVSVNFTGYSTTWPTEILKDPQFATSSTYKNAAGATQYPLMKMHVSASGLGKSRKATATVNCAHDEPILQWVLPQVYLTDFYGNPVWALNTSQAVPTLMSTGANSTTGGSLVNGSYDQILNVDVAQKNLDATRQLKCVAQVVVSDKTKGSWHNVAFPVTQSFTFNPSGK